MNKTIEQLYYEAKTPLRDSYAKLLFRNSVYPWKNERVKVSLATKAKTG